MIKLTQAEYTVIRNRLDEMEARLYHNILIFDDGYWSHKMIKRLLFIISELQEGKREEGG